MHNGLKWKNYALILPSNDKTNIAVKKGFFANIFIFIFPSLDNFAGLQVWKLTVSEFKLNGASSEEVVYIL